MVLCFWSRAQGGLGRDKIPYLEHLYYCIWYYDDLYGLSYEDFTYYLQKIQNWYKLIKYKKLMQIVKQVIYFKTNVIIDFI